MTHSELGKELIEACKEIIEIQEKRKLGGLNKNSTAIHPISNFKPEDIKSIRQKFEMPASVFAKMPGLCSKAVKYLYGVNKNTKSIN